MAKKNQYGFRNEVIKNFTPEQIHELIQQKKIIDDMNAEDAYKRIMHLLKKRQNYVSVLDFDKNAFQQFVDELARTRQQKQDGFYGFSMTEKAGGSLAQRLLGQGSFAMASVLVFYIVKYISDEKPQNEFTRRVMVNLTKDRAWEEGDEKESYATRNFHGKAVAIYQDEEFVLFLEDEFGIKDNTYEKDFSKEFVEIWAKMYLYLDEMSKSEPEKFKGLMPKKSISTEQESKYPREDCKEDDDIESIFRTLLSKQKDLANADEEAEELEEEYAQAEGEIKRLEKKIEDLNKLLQSAKQHRDEVKAEKEAAKRKVDVLCAEYNKAQQVFSKKYKMQFEE